MKLTSRAFEHDGAIPSTYTCDGGPPAGGVSPPLTISDVPSRAQRLVLIMDDPDVPKNIRADGMWDHWVVFNISPSVSQISEGSEPEGTHGKGTSGNLGYHGPCPPDRRHRYFFYLYAIDFMPDWPKGMTKEEVEKKIEGHILEKAQLMGTYELKTKQ